MRPTRRIAGRYRLDRELGRGSTGVVWAGYDEMLQRPVAVKEVLVPPGVPANEAAALRERTEREARAFAILAHPNVVTLYDVARDGGEPFIVMELLPSRSLADLLNEKAMPPGRAATIGMALSAALATAHAAGITHRDVKPGNVLVTTDGRVKLTDFGIARNPADTSLTASGLMLGSPAFIAPEVAAGKGVTPAADLWGLGATLFACVTGRPPYDVKGDPMETVTAVVHGPVPKPGIRHPLAEVISALMVKDPAARMPLREVHTKLKLLADEPIRAPFPDRSTPAPAKPGRSGAGAGATVGRKQAGALAAAPGPLPWETDAGRALAPVRQRRPLRGARAALVYAAAVLLFAVGGLASFSVARHVAGENVFPQDSEPVVESTRGAPPVLAVRPVADFAPAESTTDGSAAGGFSLEVPVGWSEYREVHNVGDVPFIAVQFVSPNGDSVITVARVPDVLPQRSPDELIDAFFAAMTDSVDRLVQVGQETIGPETEITYRTVEGRTAGATLRTTFMRVVPIDDDLWSVRVTVPTEREEAGRTQLFDRVAKTLAPLPVGGSSGGR